ncbi:MAG: hypothetical protein KGJ78_14210 [Alphaproteobacteria bacterium]|nr:hypothetical protein [Alphaproteobacteria bacterium]
MILRAAFWISVVAVFIPREPDLGFGPPGASAFPGAPTANPPMVCGAHESSCPTALNLAVDLRNTILANLDRVKAELNEQSDTASRRRDIADYMSKF